MARVLGLLSAGADPNAVRAPGGEEDFQPDTPLKMAMFRLSDLARLEQDDHALAPKLQACYWSMVLTLVLQ